MTIHRWYENWLGTGADRREVRRALVPAVALFLGWSVFIGEEGRGDCMQIVAHKSRKAFDRSRFVG